MTNIQILFLTNYYDPLNIYDLFMIYLLHTIFGFIDRVYNDFFGIYYDILITFLTILTFYDITILNYKWLFHDKLSGNFLMSFSTLILQQTFICYNTTFQHWTHFLGSKLLWFFDVLYGSMIFLDILYYNFFMIYLDIL